MTGRWFQSLIVWGKKELNRTGCLVCSWCSRWAPLVLGSAWGQKLVRSISTNPLLIRYSIWSRLWSLVCLGLQHRVFCWYELCLPGLFGAPTPGCLLVRTVSVWSVWSSNTGVFVATNLCLPGQFRAPTPGCLLVRTLSAWSVWSSNTGVWVRMKFPVPGISGAQEPQS